MGQLCLSNALFMKAGSVTHVTMLVREKML